MARCAPNGTKFSTLLAPSVLIEVVHGFLCIGIYRNTQPRVRSPPAEEEASEVFKICVQAHPLSVIYVPGQSHTYVRPRYPSVGTFERRNAGVLDLGCIARANSLASELLNPVPLGGAQKILPHPRARND